MPKIIKTYKEKVPAFLSEREKMSVFQTVKKYIDALDIMGLLDMGAPNDEYDIESRMIADRVTSDTTSDELAEIIATVFSEMFGEKMEKDTFVQVSQKIRSELN